MDTAQFLTQWKSARNAGCPLIGVETSDTAITMQRCANSTDATAPLFVWNACDGLQPANAAARDVFPSVMQDAEGNPIPQDVTINCTQMLQAVGPRLPENGVIFAMNVHRYLAAGGPDGVPFLQAIWNLRDPYKANFRTLVLMGPRLSLPAEVSGDVVVLEDPLPDDSELAALVSRVAKDNDTPLPDAVVPKAVNALRGLGAFPAEQAVAMSLRAKGVDLDNLWLRKERLITATPGLSVFRNGPTLADVGGCEAVKGWADRKAKGKRPFEVVVFIDEGEKMFAGAGGDNTGISQEFLRGWLVKQQEWNLLGGSGALFVGAPGVAKSMVASAIGATYGVITVFVDLGAAKASLVGESEARLAAMFRVIDAISKGRVLVIMTCNKQVALPPEMKRRFTGGTWYFDLPDEAEQALIWPKYFEKYGIAASERKPACVGWTGAEIRTACELHWEMGIPLVDTAQYIVPVVKSAAEDIALLRQQAHGRFLSASRPGAYLIPPTTAPGLPEGGAKRRVAAER